MISIFLVFAPVVTYTLSTMSIFNNSQKNASIEFKNDSRSSNFVRFMTNHYYFINKKVSKTFMHVNN